MLAQLKGPGDVEAEVQMMRNYRDGAFLIVEGESDSRFWSAWVRQGDCEVVIGGGKTAVVGAISRLDQCAFKGAVGIVDDDCDSLLGRQATSPNLCVTHARDLEGVLLQTAALSRVLAEHGEVSKVRECSRAGVDVAARLVDNCLLLGQLRWLAYRDALGIDFKALSPERFVSEDTWTIDAPSLIATVVSKGHFSDAASLERALESLPSADPWLVVQGHDLVQALSIGLRSFLGQSNSGREGVAKALRLGVDRADLEATPLWADLLAWEQRNHPYQVLR